MDKDVQNKPPTHEDLEDMQNASILEELWGFLRVRKRFWLAPIILTLMLLGLLMIFAGSAGVVSPFVYMM